MNKDKFCKKYNISEQQFNGKEKFSGDLDLRSVKSIPEGFNPTVGGYLYLGSVTSIPEGFNPTVGGDLDLRSVTSIPEGFNPTVGGYLYLGSVTSIPKGFNPTVGGYLYLGSVTSIPKGFNPTVGGYLDLRSVTSIPEGFNPTVGGDLYLRSVTSIPEGFNPTVGGYLDLRSVTSIPEGFNPTVGGYLYLGSGRKRIGSIIKPIQINKNFFWTVENKKYAKIDGIFCEIISEKEKNIGDKTYIIFSAKKVNKNETFFISNIENYYAHGSDLKKSIEDLNFKIISEKLKNEPINKDTAFTVKYYRLLTGACDFGCREFMDKHKIDYDVIDNKAVEKKSITAEKLLPLLEKSNSYGLEKFKKLITF